MKVLIPLALAGCLLGCGRPSAQRAADPPLDPALALAVNQMADRAIASLDEYSPNPIGKYQAVSIYGWPARLDTQSGRLWILLPARTQYNPSDQNVWRELVSPTQ